ncbi:hypothetical protein BJX70DRAFT_399627 [Aspergillus crustosus]
MAAKRLSANGNVVYHRHEGATATQRTRPTDVVIGTSRRICSVRRWGRAGEITLSRSRRPNHRFCPSASAPRLPGIRLSRAVDPPKRPITLRSPSRAHSMRRPRHSSFSAPHLRRSAKSQHRSTRSARIPFTLTPEDQFLLHSYLLHVPAQLYGTWPEATFSAVRDVSFPISLRSSQTLSWMLIAANGLFTNETSGSGKEISLGRRKQQAYGPLKDAIGKSGGRVSDDVLGGIIMAGITEARAVGPDCGSCTPAGALRLAHLMPYLVSEPTPTPATGGIDEAEQMQQFVQFLSMETRHRGFSPCPVDVSPENGLRLLQQTIIRSALLQGPIAFHLGRHPTSTAFVAESSSFLATFLLTLTVWRISESIDNVHLFISRVEAVLVNSAAFNPQSGQSLLTEQGFLWAVIRAIQEIQESGLSAYDVEGDSWAGEAFAL